MDLVAGRYFADERRPIRHLDPVLIGSASVLSIIGLFLIYSSKHARLVALHSDPMYFVKKQITAMVLGLILLLLVALVDYRFFKVYAGFIYAAALTMLVLVRIPGVGTTQLGAQRWFQFAGFQFTPSEFTKIALIIMLSAILSELRSPEPTLRDTFRVCLVAAVPMILVFVQPDIGTTIVLVAITVGVLVVAGARGRHLAAIAVGAVIMIALAFQLGVVKDYQLARLTGFLDPANNSLTTNYNKAQAEIAVGSGGILGSGYLKGTQTNLEFVPEQYTDFIFTVAGEEFGFVGAMVLLSLFAVIIWRAIRISYLAKDPFGTYMSAAIAAMFAIQMFVNIGMVIGIMPITGIPLPLVSYGGTATMANFVAVGLLLNIHMRRFK
jgi:rod shape determining protein RodA